MNWWKIILALLIAILGIYLVFFIIGMLYSLIWYLFIIGILGLGGYAGYRYLTKEKNKELTGADPISELELNNAKIVRELEEIKSRLKR